MSEAEEMHEATAPDEESYEETTEPVEPEVVPDSRGVAIDALVAQAEETKTKSRAPKARPAKKDKGSTPTIITEEPEATSEPEAKPVTQRRRGKMASGKGTPSFKGVPRDKIIEAMDTYHQVDLRISRVNARGGRSSMGSFVKSPAEVNDIELWLRDLAGGGRFHVDPLKHGEAGRADPIPPFEIEIDGPAKAMKGSEINTQPAQYGIPMAAPGMGAPMMAAGGMPMGAGAPFVDPKHLPNFARGMEPQHQVAYARSMGIPVQTGHPGQAPANAFASDQIANKELDRAKEELARERAAREEERKEAQQREEETRRRMDRMEAQRAEDQRKAEADRHALEMDRMRADQARDREQFQQQMQALQNRPVEAPKPTFSPEMLTALGGIVTAFISSNNERAARQAEMQAQGQQALLQATMAKGDSKPMMDMLKQVMPVAAPLLASFWESKSPKAQADLVATMAENQLTSISMMAELINSFGAGQENPPFWLPMAQETLRGVVQAAETMANKNKDVGGSPVQAPTALPASAPTPAAAPASQVTAEPPFSPEQITQMIMQDSRYPAWGRTPEWAQALTLLHGRSPDAAPYIANMLATLDRENRTPPEIADVWDRADEVLANILRPMPIWGYDNEYAVGVINQIIEILGGGAPPEEVPAPVMQDPPPEAQVVVPPAPEPPATQVIETTGETAPKEQQVG
jgi:hypothetical protein